MVRFDKRGKLAPRYIGPFQIIERAGIVAYRLALPPSLSSVYEVFHVSTLWKYTQDPNHVVDWGEITIDTDRTFEEGPVRILDSRDQVLRCKTVRLVKVLWQHRGVEEATWEREDTMRATYHFLFEDEGAWSNIEILILELEKLLHMHVFVCMNFGDEILLKGEECKTREKFSFLGKGKMAISVGNQKFSRSWMTKRTSLLNLSREI